MADIDANTQLALPDNHLITVTHVVYALHAFSVIPASAARRLS